MLNFVFIFCLSWKFFNSKSNYSISIYFTITIVVRVHSLLIMPITNMQWRVETGIFNTTSKARYFKKKSLRVVVFHFSFGFRFVFIVLILFVCADVKLNPDPKNRNSCYNFSICQWNLNSITARNFAKVNLLWACNVIHDFDMIRVLPRFICVFW